MNVAIAIILAIIALLFLIKPVITGLCNDANNRPKLRHKLNPIRALYVVLGLILLVWGIILNPTISALGLTLVIIAAIILIASILILGFRSSYTAICQSIMQHYFLWMIPLSIATAYLALFALTRSYIGPIAAVMPCEQSVQNLNADNITIICGVKNPEDLIETPDGKYILLSEFGSILPLNPMTAGGFKLLDLNTSKLIQPKITYQTNDWGAVNCSADQAKQFGPHGIDLVQRIDNRYQLAVISHYPRESIELFELLPDDANAWQLIWRGCILTPENHYLNDIALNRDGSFYTTHMYNFDFSLFDVIVQSILKNNTGYVLHWSIDTGFNQLANSAGSMPNGITLNRQQQLLYVAFNFGDKIKAFDLASGKAIATQNISGPDNMIYDGTSLWATGLDHQILDSLVCKQYSTCPLPFSIFELEPTDLTIKQRYRLNPDNFGFVTVALPIGDKIWLGTFHGDRMAFIAR